MSSGTSNAVWWYLHELTSRVVAQSGTSSDRYHLGKILLQCFKDVPNMIMQVKFLLVISIVYKKNKEIDIYLLTLVIKKS